MLDNDKILVSMYLKYLNDEVKNSFMPLKRKSNIRFLTCKDVATICGVTQATISNLSTSSKFDLLYKVADVIYSAYYDLFMYNFEKDRQEYSDEPICYPDEFYVLRYMTLYFTKDTY